MSVRGWALCELLLWCLVFAHAPQIHKQTQGGKGGGGEVAKGHKKRMKGGVLGSMGGELLRRWGDVWILAAETRGAGGIQFRLQTHGE